MMLSGAKPQCISDDIDTEFPFNLKDLGSNVPSAINTLSPGMHIPVNPFRTFLEGCRLIFDYTNQRIVVYNPTTARTGRVNKYAYVYSLKSNKWGTMESDINYAVNAYPTTLIVNDTNDIMEFLPKSSDDVDVRCLLLTRPLNLDAPDVLKTIDMVVARGRFSQTDGRYVKSILWGSRDLVNWFPVRSSNNHFLRGFSGTPYKYFRLALLSKLGAEESLYGATIRFKAKYINNLH
jgi:hypothetical protein